MKHPCELYHKPLFCCLRHTRWQLKVIGREFVDVFKLKRILDFFRNKV